MKYYTKIIDENSPQIKNITEKFPKKELVHHRIVTEIFNTKCMIYSYIDCEKK